MKKMDQLIPVHAGCRSRLSEMLLRVLIVNCNAVFFAPLKLQYFGVVALVRMSLYPKSCIDVFVTVIEDGGGSLAAAITAAGQSVFSQSEDE